MSGNDTSPLDILDFWWQAGPEKWFAGGEAFDTECRDRFLGAVEAARDGALDGWAETAAGALALILLLDQMPRNIYRGTPDAFASDAKAVEIADLAVTRGHDRAFPKDVRVFFYLPFEHAEDIALQERCVDLTRKLGKEQLSLYAYIHLDVIRRFGRFPHRNDVLGRASTEAEKAFLADGGFSA